MGNARIWIVIGLLLLISGVHATNQTDLCLNVTCTTPPANFCSGSVANIYPATGICSNGVCIYAYSATNCPYGCTNGACSLPTFSCSDTDGGENLYVKGTMTWTFANTSGSSTDSCQSDGRIVEHFCYNNISNSEMVYCPSGKTCVDGACVLQADPCANVTCNSPPANFCVGNIAKVYPTTGTCSNGQCSYTYTATTCPSACSNGVCIQANTSALCDGVVCNSPPANFCYGDYAKTYNTPGTCSNGQCTYVYTPTLCPNGCLNGVCRTQSCPAPPQCAAGATLTMTSEANGCPVYTCGTIAPKTYKFAKWSCYDGSSSQSGTCMPEDQLHAAAEKFCYGKCLGDKCGVNSFAVGTECAATTAGYCPTECECGTDAQGNLVVKYCRTQQSCNNNGKCEAGESNCQDCVAVQTCPVTKQCPDGSTVPCYLKDSGCSCGTCAISAKNLPAGCTQEVDQNTGFIRVVCSKTACETISPEAKQKCTSNGGTPAVVRSPNGCDVFQCSFGETGAFSLFVTAQSCPATEDVKQEMLKCESLSMKGVIMIDRGCSIAKCVNPSENKCGDISESDLKQKQASCDKQLITTYDQNGCKVFVCGDENNCAKDPPSAAYDKCSKKGGNLIVKKDANGCISYSECVGRGDASDANVDNVDHVPDSSDLLTIAFKLEELKLDLDKLARKSDDMANYYQTTGSSDEQRFRRVAAMFNAAKDKVDAIRADIKNNLNNMTIDKATKIKRDIRYIKEVVIKDIVYVMLSDNADIDKIKNNTAVNCDNDEACFNDALRICQPVTFSPGDSEGFLVNIIGLQDNKCAIHVSVSGDLPKVPGISPPYEMDCRLENYALGVTDPQKDVLPYCSGNLVMAMKLAEAGNAIAAANNITFEIPGLCSGTEACKTYCLSSTQNAENCYRTAKGNLPPDFVSKITEIITRKSTSQIQTIPTASCSGCLNNGVCDPGECSTCEDCRGG